MHRESAKRLALDIVRGWGHFRPADWEPGYVYAPYIPLYGADDPNSPHNLPFRVGIDHAVPGQDRTVVSPSQRRIAFLTAEIQDRIRRMGRGADPVLERMSAELQELRLRVCRGVAVPPEFFQRQSEPFLRRFAEAELRLSQHYGRYVIST